jgi:hypothetical protein
MGTADPLDFAGLVSGSFFVDSTLAYAQIGNHCQMQLKDILQAVFVPGAMK